MSCFSTGRLDNDRETADKENAAGGKGISHCDNKAGYDCDQGKGRHGEPGIGEEHAEELFANVTDDAHLGPTGETGRVMASTLGHLEDFDKERTRSPLASAPAACLCG